MIENAQPEITASPLRQHLGQIGISYSERALMRMNFVQPRFGPGSGSSLARKAVFKKKMSLLKSYFKAISLIGEIVI